MDNLGVRLPVDARAKSKFKAQGLTSHMKEKMTVGSRKPARNAWLCEKYRPARLDGRAILPTVCARIQQI